MGNKSRYKIPLLVPSVPKIEVITEYLKRIDESKHYSNFGPLETELRTRLAQVWQVPVKNIVSACNATLALQGAIETSVPNEHSWKVPSWTFIATALAIQKAGREFSFVDVNPQTWRPNFSDEDENILDVLPFGDNLDLDRMRKKPITNLVIDAAASFSALSKPLPNSIHKYAIVISLHATKLLPAGEGAVMVTNCEDWASRFRSWTNFGFSNQRRPSLLGTNAKLSEYAAAVALGSIDEFDYIKERLFQIQEEARLVSSSIGLQTHPAMRKGLVSPYWILDFETSSQKQSALSSLTLDGIESRDWWERGCHNEELFGKTDSNLPITNSLASTTLGIPMHLNLTGSDLEVIQRSLEVKL